MLDFDIYIKCVKRKTTNKRNKDANRCNDILELMRTDIYGSFLKASWTWQIYFTSFIDGYSRYDYFSLIHDKLQSLDMFKLFESKVGNQLGKKIKAINCDSEYYDRYNIFDEQYPGSSVEYLVECEIVPQYSMPGNCH